MSACWKILFVVIGGRTSLGLPATVTRPDLTGCLNRRRIAATVNLLAALVMMVLFLPPLACALLPVDQFAFSLSHPVLPSRQVPARPKIDHGSGS